MAVFIDKGQNPWNFYDNGTEIPNKPADIEITEEANNYYWENKGRFNIDLDKITGGIITLEGIMQYAVDAKSEKQYELNEVDNKLLKIRDEEYLNEISQVEGAAVPAMFSVNTEKLELIARRVELLDEINELEESEQEA